MFDRTPLCYASLDILSKASALIQLRRTGTEEVVKPTKKRPNIVVTADATLAITLTPPQDAASRAVDPSAEFDRLEDTFPED